MTILLAIVAALAIIAFGIVLRLYLNERMHNEFAVSAAGHLGLQVKKEAGKREMLEKEITVLRNANRSATKVWSNERRRLWAQARDAERLASEMQEFHRHNEFSLQHELAGAHALIELLLEMAPKGAFEMPHVSEVRRLFTPVIEMDQHRPRAKTNPHVF